MQEGVSLRQPNPPSGHHNGHSGSQPSITIPQAGGEQWPGRRFPPGADLFVYRPTYSHPGGRGLVGEQKSTQQLSSLKLETHRRRQARHGDGGTRSAPGPRSRARRPGCQETEYPVSTEQLLVFLAVWFLYVFYLQDYF